MLTNKHRLQIMTILAKDDYYDENEIVKNVTNGKIYVHETFGRLFVSTYTGAVLDFCPYMYKDKVPKHRDKVPAPRILQFDDMLVEKLIWFSQRLLSYKKDVDHYRNESYRLADECYRDE